MSEKAKEPVIRFKGFSEEWEEKKLNEITDVRDGTHNSPKYVQEGHPFITSKNVSNGFINYDDIQYVTDEDYEEINKRSKVDIHDILMGMIGTIGNLALIRKEPDFAIKNVALIKYTGDVDYQYLYQALQANYVTSQLVAGMDGGTQKFVALKKIRELDIPFPNIEEQQKIGSYFRQLDRLITLYQRKYNKLTSVKKSMLQKMFPASGQTVPALRFAGFTDKWEVRKLGEVVRLNGRIGFRGYTEKDIISREEGGVLTFSPTNIVDNKLTTNCRNTYITRFKYDESPEIKVHNGDILFVKTGSTLGKSALITGLSEDATLNPQLVVMRVNKDDKEFISSMLITDNVLQQVCTAKIGGAVPTLTETKIKDFDVAIPSKLEQQKIGSYFRQLDHLIALHQQELQKLQNLKKACLKKMFV